MLINFQDVGVQGIYSPVNVSQVTVRTGKLHDAFKTVLSLSSRLQKCSLIQLYFPLLLFHSYPTSPLGKNTFSVLPCKRWKKSW